VILVISCVLYIQLGSRFENNFELCLGSYLKQNDLIGSNFSMEEFRGSPEICRVFVNLRLWSEISKVDDLFSYQNNSDIVNTCIKGQTHKPLFLEEILKHTFYSTSKRMPKHEIEMKKSETARKITNSLHRYQFSCRLMAINEWFLSHISDASKKFSLFSSDHFLEKDFCWKTFIKRKKILQSSFDLTPLTEVKYEEQFCYHQVVAPIKAIIVESYWTMGFPINDTPINERMCVIENIEHDLVIDKILAVYVATMLGMTDEQLAIEKIHFARIMRRVLNLIWWKCYAAKPRKILNFL
jgi:hypothetical protein